MQSHAPGVRYLGLRASMHPPTAPSLGGRYIGIHDLRQSTKSALAVKATEKRDFLKSGTEKRRDTGEGGVKG